MESTPFWIQLFKLIGVALFVLAIIRYLMHPSIDKLSEGPKRTKGPNRDGGSKPKGYQEKEILIPQEPQKGQAKAGDEIGSPQKAREILDYAKEHPQKTAQEVRKWLDEGKRQ